MPFQPPRIADDPTRTPRWYKQALGTVEERGDRLWFVPNRVHPISESKARPEQRLPGACIP